MNTKTARRWFCDNCQCEHRSWPEYCRQEGHAFRRICGYSLCFQEVGSRTTCSEEHEVLAKREALKFSAPPITTTSGEWLFRERLRLGFSRAEIVRHLNQSGIRVCFQTLASYESRDRALPSDWLAPLGTLDFQEPAAQSTATHGAKASAKDRTRPSSPDQSYVVEFYEGTDSWSYYHRFATREEAEVFADGVVRSDRSFGGFQLRASQLPPSRLEDGLVVSAAREKGREEAVRAALASTVTPEVTIAQFIQAWVECDDVFAVLTPLPLHVFWSWFQPYPRLLIRQPPKTEPFDTFLPKSLAYHLERETVLALSKMYLSEMLTTDFLIELQTNEVLGRIKHFPMLTFLFALEYGVIPEDAPADEADSDLKADFTTGRRDADG